LTSIDASERSEGRPEQRRGRTSRYLTIGAALVLVLVNARRLEGGMFWGVAAMSGVIILLGYLWNRRVAGGLGDLVSRGDLSQAVSQARGMRRMNLVWYEYVIARNVARGTYRDEPPVDFKSDAYDASMRMGLATKGSMRQLVWVFVFLVVLSFTVSFMVASDDLAFALIMSLGGIVLFGFTMGIVLLFVWWKSRSQLSRLGRRIEDAAQLESDQRWQALTEIALAEISLEAGA